MDLTVLCHARNEWDTKTLLPSNKGQDILIKGWAKYIKTNNIYGKLILLEYGNDVNSSKRLIDELEIGKSVIWIKKLQREDVYKLIYCVDICCGEFRLSGGPNGVHQEVIVMGKPLMTFRDEKRNPPMYDYSISFFC